LNYRIIEFNFRILHIWTSWDVSSIEEFHKQLKDQIHQDISEQPENNQSYRLQLPGKCGEYDLPGNEEREYSDRITIGICATGVYQPHSDLSDEPCQRWASQVKSKSIYEEVFDALIFYF
jgi:hypothetical protein